MILVPEHLCSLCAASTDRGARGLYGARMPRLMLSLLSLLTLFGCASDPLSDTQQRFLSVRGNPSVFTIAFADRELDATGMAVATPERRVEVWLYDGSPARQVVFDNGFYVRTQMAVSGLSAPSLEVSPADFTHGMARAEVEARLGAPDRVETGMLGSQSLEVLRYEVPDVVAVSFVDGALTSVVAGLQVSP